MKINTRIIGGVATLLLGIGLSLACGQAGDGDSREALEADEVDEEGGALVLAEVTFPSGAEVVFLGLPAEDEYGCLLSLPYGSEAPVGWGDEGPEDCLDFFLNITPDDVAVPQLMVDLSPLGTDDPRLPDRVTAPAVDEPIDAQEFGLTASADPQSGGTSGRPYGASRYCDSSSGASRWYNERCPWYSLTQCDSFKTKITHSNSRNTYRSHGNTAACGAAANAKHYYKNIWGNWKHLYSKRIEGNQGNTTSYKGSSKRNRRVIHQTVSTQFGNVHGTAKFD